jgi:competence protein ComEC
MRWWVLKRRVHVSWLITIACGGIVVGVFCAKFIRLDFVWVFPLLVLFITALKSGRLYAVPLVLISGLLLGLVRGSSIQTELDNYKPYYGKQITTSGIVTDDTDIDSSGKVKLRLSNIVINNNKLSGLLWISANDLLVQRGDTLILSGKLNRGFGNFAGVIYEANIYKVVHPNSPNLALGARNWFSGLVRQSIPEPQASLGDGLLLGERRSLPASLVTALQVVGLTHVVVASGYNLTILVRLARRLFEKVSKYLSLFTSITLIFGFLAITGISPSMSRAGLVSVLSLAAWYYGRRFHPITLLLIAMAVTVIINPIYIWGDLGWQLSFAAFAGIMILAPLLRIYFFGDKKPKFVGQILIETISAQIMTAPIIVFAFGMFSNVAVIANILVLPVVPFAMLLTFISGLGTAILPTLATIIGLPAHLLLSYITSVIDFFSDLPWAASEVKIGILGLVICYALIATACFYLWRVTKYNLREVNIVE